MLEELKKQVYEANIELNNRGVVLYTFGNVSGISREDGLVVIKPSGVDYAQLRAEDMVVVDLQTGEVVEGKYRPSSGTPTHLEIYRSFSEVNGVAHTHSIYATVFAQAGLGIPALGTTHADYFHGEIPCTDRLTEKEVLTDYELNTGKAIVRVFNEAEESPAEIPAVLAIGHGPFTFGKDAAEAVYHSVVLEQVAMMAWHTLQFKTGCQLDDYVLDKHYSRKHGANAYYGQK